MVHLLEQHAIISLQCRRGPLVAIGCEPGQIRKEAAAAVDSGTWIRLGGIVLFYAGNRLLYMSYMALARKWRPQNFNDVVGQEHVVRALGNSLDSGRVHHAFLFEGTRGVGKTTIARIFAKALNCEQGVSSNPCGECSACTAINEGRFVDLLEVDAASRTRVDDTRELLDNVQYAPSSGRYKIYLIDEVHMLSTHSFNALLKTLEEPPEHVKFLLATTDPQKLPVTILSRCLQFGLRALRPEQIEQQLMNILKKENIEYEKAALTLLARAADGSMRDGLSLLDQAIAQGKNKVEQESVRSMLGTISGSQLLQLVEVMCHGDALAMTKLVSDMVGMSVDFAKALNELLVNIYHASLNKVSTEAFAALDGNDDAVSMLSDQFSAEHLQLLYQIGVLGKRDMHLAPDMRTGMEMTLLRMLAFEPSSSSGPSGSDSGGAESVTQSAIKSNPAGVQTVSKKLDTQATTETSETADVPIPAEPAVPEQKAYDVTVVEEPHTEFIVEASVTTEIAAPESAAEDKVVQVSVEAMLDEDPEPVALEVEQQPLTDGVAPASDDKLFNGMPWYELIEQLEVKGLAKELAMHCVLDTLSDGRAQLFICESDQQLLSDSRKAAIQAALTKHLGAECQVDLQVSNVGSESPARRRQRIEDERMAATKDSMLNSQGVNDLMNEFGASLRESSIQPAAQEE